MQSIFSIVSNTLKNTFLTNEKPTEQTEGTLGLIEDKDPNKPGSIGFNGKEYGMSYTNVENYFNERIVNISKTDYENLVNLDKINNDTIYLITEDDTE